MSYEVRAQALLRAYQDEVEHDTTPPGQNLKPESLASNRAILSADPGVQVALLRLVLYSPSLREWYGFYHLRERLSLLVPWTEWNPTNISEALEKQAEALWNAYFVEVQQSSTDWDLSPETLATGRSILAAKGDLLIALMHHINKTAANIASDHRHWHALFTLQRQLYRRSLPYSTEDIQAIVGILSCIEMPYIVPCQAILRALVSPLAKDEVLASCRAALEKLQKTVQTRWYEGADRVKFLRLLDDILNKRQESTLSLRGDDWGIPLLAALKEMSETQRAPWLALLQHCATAKSSIPGSKWLAAIPPLVEPLGTENFCRQATAWIGVFSNKGSRLDEENAILLKGLIWSCSGIGDAVLAAALGNAAIEGYRKIPGLGPRSAKVAGACIFTLKTMDIQYGAAQLERIRLNVKQPTYLKGLEQALDEMAQRAGMSRADLEELTIPSFDLEQGRLNIRFGSALAQLEVSGLHVSIQWSDSTGKLLKKEPAEVRKTYKAELKDLKRLSDDIIRMLGAQRDRLEHLPLDERQWSLPLWRSRYLEHPLVGQIARRLLWRFQVNELVRSGIWLDGQLVDVADRPLALPENAIVSSWHPVFCSAEEVLEWRNWLERHQITQPFKQVHREIYLLTDAERATRVYSNRFAAHILRQHQFNALAAARQWRNQLRLMVDDSYAPATYILSRWGLRAEFWIEGAGEEYGVDTNEAGTYLYVATDQVRFYPLTAALNSAHAGGGGYAPGFNRQTRQVDENEPLPLEQIPPLVFSEVMRDVDLFVGVASVGNDPTWQDGGPQGRYQNYWHSYSFGELSTTAETRKHLLSRLIPQLVIADRCQIEGRYLRVRGDRRVYKIHLGSGNILMEPNDQYLCIVPSRSQNESVTEKLFLPFEGDNVLSIILSKAFLLAEDSKISDSTITRQISPPAR